MYVFSYRRNYYGKAQGKLFKLWTGITNVSEHVTEQVIIHNEF